MCFGEIVDISLAMNLQCNMTEGEHKSQVKTLAANHKVERKQFLIYNLHGSATAVSGVFH